MQTVSSSGKLASANRASFRPHSLATIYHAKKNAVNETNRRKSDLYLLLAEAINPLRDTLLIALPLRGGRANKEQQQIAVYGTIYLHFCPIRLDAQMIAFIRACLLFCLNIAAGVAYNYFHSLLLFTGSILDYVVCITRAVRVTSFVVSVHQYGPLLALL